MTDISPQQKGGFVPQATDDEILAALRECWNAGERDPLEGGVRKTSIAKRVDLSTTQVKTRLRDLRQRGDVTLVWGINPETYRPRPGYAPAEEIDNPPEDLPGDTLRGAPTDD